ncbi:hypothetical protein GGD50_001481 [Rhizobium paranaense]|uniref:Uncharacterized protein n=1 Tax=Rhizobium paranaense TaxID=1650438 RepID=A0A7W8XNU9_9HYPH|nr:hypothetical protein [Rhizobium paranaense]
MRQQAALIRCSPFTVSTAQASRRRVAAEKTSASAYPRCQACKLCVSLRAMDSCRGDRVGRASSRIKHITGHQTDEYRQRLERVDKLELRSGTQRVPDLEDTIVKKMHRQV